LHTSLWNICIQQWKWMIIDIIKQSSLQINCPKFIKNVAMFRVKKNLFKLEQYLHAYWLLPEFTAIIKSWFCFIVQDSQEAPISHTIPYKIVAVQISTCYIKMMFLYSIKSSSTPYTPLPVLGPCYKDTGEGCWLGYVLLLVCDQCWWGNVKNWVVRTRGWGKHDIPSCNISGHYSMCYAFVNKNISHGPLLTQTVCLSWNSPLS
jgi:hypothetical protein